MTKFWMVTEDPMYDEDGVMVDEDGPIEYEEPNGWFDLDGAVVKKPQSDELSPFQTINS